MIKRMLSEGVLNLLLDQHLFSEYETKYAVRNASTEARNDSRKSNGYREKLLFYIIEEWARTECPELEKFEDSIGDGIVSTFTSEMDTIGG